MNPQSVRYPIESQSQGREALKSALARFPGRLEAHPIGRSTYLDTFDWRLYREGGSLLSSTDGRVTVLRWTHLDGTPVFRARLRANPEFVWDLPAGPFRQALDSVVEMRRLLPRLEITSRGETLHLLDTNRKTVARLHFEAASATGTGSVPKTLALPILLTAEPVRGYARDFQALVDLLEDEFQLQAASSDPLTMALEALGLEPSASSGRLTVQLAPEMRSDEATKRIHKELLQAILDNEEGVRQDLDTEFLHDFRVAVRRTRSALTQIKKVYPPDVVEHFKRQFAWLGQATGPTRDLDVYLLKMPDYRATLPEHLQTHLEPLQEFLTRHQRLEHQRLVEDLDSQRYSQLLESWRSFLDDPVPEAASATSASPQAEVPVGQTASNRIWKAYRRVLKQGQSIDADSPPESLHRLRIDCKKLRYLLELFKSLYDKQEMGTLVKALKRLQDNLGDFNDLEVQQATLRSFAHDMFQEGLATVETLMALGRLVDRLESRQADERQRFQREFAKFASRKNRSRFRALFEQHETVAK